MSSNYITIYFVGQIFIPSCTITAQGDGLMIFNDDGAQGDASTWASDVNYTAESGNRLGSQANPYDSNDLTLGAAGTPTNPCKDAQQPDAQFSLNVTGNNGDVVRLTIELMATDFENYTNTAPCNQNKTIVNALGDFVSRKFSEIGTGVGFSAVRVTTAFFNRTGMYYENPFRTNFELAGMGPLNLLEYTVGTNAAAVPGGTNVSSITNVTGQEIFFSVTLNQLQCTGTGIAWPDGKYALPIEITCEMNP